MLYINILKFIYFYWRTITWQHCGVFESASGIHASPDLEPCLQLPPHPTPLGCPRAPVLGALLHASNLHWPFNLHMVIYMLQCYFLKSPHPHLLPLVQNSVLYVCVSLAAHVGTSMTSF